MAKLRKCHQSHDRDAPKPDRANSLKPDQLSLNSCKATLGRVPISGILGHRKFSDKLAIDRAAAFPKGSTFLASAIIMPRFTTRGLFDMSPTAYETRRRHGRDNPQ